MGEFDAELAQLQTILNDVNAGAAQMRAVAAGDATAAGLDAVKHVTGTVDPDDPDSSPVDPTTNLPNV